MKEKEIQKIMWHYLDGKRVSIVVPNIYLYYPFESDLIAVTKSNFVYEFEIKTSLADLKRDLSKKVKRTEKHKRLRNKSTEKAPNRFFFCCSFAVDLSLIPSYAGLISIYGKEPKTIKNAPLLHKRKLSEKNKTYIMRGLSKRLWAVR